MELLKVSKTNKGIFIYPSIFFYNNNKFISFAFFFHSSFKACKNMQNISRNVHLKPFATSIVMVLAHLFN